MKRRTTQGIAVGGVVALALVIAAYELRPAAPPPAAARSSRPTTGVSEAAVAAPGRNLAYVDLSALDVQKVEPRDLVRDPFRFKPAAAPSPAAKTPGARLVVPQQMGPVDPPPAPRIPLKFIGVMEAQKQGVIAVLSDTRGVYHGAVGETIEGRYRIEHIGVESIELSYIDGRGRQTIRLTGQ
jgi:hypothetical protein